ncbi:endonuclease VIII [Actinorhabdospora filicis]|uniref:DNA-(apurinic or apyrimidinic site) lyase n=1 Tax=Actinorhabdospora filicis TaxID=1785913 RepID=A0A9W6SIM5_9ACTN|nr:DNA-formamidopyrimidine glycosylase family protein [Actinorhabdospora filicis]GLZ76194.1 endonuclease VIII [Actinorhabdospora filicis]
MPEGHVIHRLAGTYTDRFGGRVTSVTSPQGRFAASAKLLDGSVFEAAEAFGKHLFLGFGDAGWVRVHLGLYGKVAFAEGPGGAAVGQVRLRVSTSDGHADLRGPAACELIGEAEREAVLDRLGPDPLRADADPERAWRRISRSRTSIAALLMNQEVVAGVGNIYRAEVLFRHGVDPYREGRNVTRDEWDAMWADLVVLMRAGVGAARIDTVREEHTPEAMGRPPRVDDHGGEVYVYRRASMPCLVCGTPVAQADLAARNLFWCPSCQEA